MGVLATIASFTAHAADSIEIGNLRKAAPEISQAIDQNPKLFNSQRVLEIAGVQPYEWDATLNGVCYEATASLQAEQFFAEQLGESSIQFQKEEDGHPPSTITVLVKHSEPNIRPPGCGGGIDFQIYIASVGHYSHYYQAESLHTAPFSFKYGEWYPFTRKARLQNRSWAS